MREIKFRFYDQEKREWLGLYQNVIVSIGGNGTVYLLDATKKGRPVTKPKGHLDEYTGLRDKNGKEIYEGDIVFAHMNNARYEIKFGTHTLDGEACHGFYALQLCEYLEEYLAEGLGDAQKYFEVIGNIHENPELLK